MASLRKSAAGYIKGEVSAFKRERIVSAALELFYARGYENTTLDEVAHQLGVTKPFIYSHFDSKADLLSEICARGIKASLDAMNEVIKAKTSPAEQLDDFIKKFTCVVLDNQKHIAVFSRELKNLNRSEFERISDMRREFDRKLKSLLDKGVARREFHVNDTSLAALAIGGMVSWSYVWYRPGGRLPLPELAQQMAVLVLQMLKAKLPASIS